MRALARLREDHVVEVIGLLALFLITFVGRDPEEGD